MLLDVLVRPLDRGSGLTPDSDGEYLDLNQTDTRTGNVLGI